MPDLFNFVDVRLSFNTEAMYIGVVPRVLHRVWTSYQFNVRIGQRMNACDLNHIRVKEKLYRCYQLHKIAWNPMWY
jgi:hypothetical protein